jgi:hypothetical protein
VGVARCGSQAWSARGQSHVTIVVKATFARQGERMVLADDPDPVLVRDEHHERNPTRSLRDVSDLAPYLRAAEVLFSGEARVPTAGDEARLTVELAGGGGIDKRIGIMTTAPVAVTYENARGGPGSHENPVGRAEPLLVDPRRPDAPVGLGPIARGWRLRGDRVTLAARRSLQGNVLRIEDDGAWEYFQAAPLDQRIASFFLGNERITLVHLAGEPRLELTLPGARAEAWLLRHGEPAKAIHLVADLMRIDGRRQRVCLTWRGFVAAEESERLVVTAAVAMPGERIEWPEVDEDVAEEASSASSPAKVRMDETGALDLRKLGADSLPYAMQEASGRPRAPVVGTPAPPIGPSPSDVRVTDKPRSPSAFDQTVAADERVALRAALPFGARAPAKEPARLPDAPWTPPPVAASTPAITAGAPVSPQFAPGAPSGAVGAAPAELRLPPGLGSELLLALAERRMPKR